MLGLRYNNNSIKLQIFKRVLDIFLSDLYKYNR